MEKGSSGGIDKIALSANYKVRNGTMVEAVMRLLQKQEFKLKEYNTDIILTYKLITSHAAVLAG